MPPKIRDYRLTIKVHNNQLLERIEDRGFSTVVEFCREYNLQYTTVSSLTRMAIPATAKRGWTEIALRLAAILETPAEILFGVPEPAHRSIVRKVDAADILSLNDAAAMRLLESKDTTGEALENKELAAKALRVLSPRQRAVVEKTFGLDGGGERTLDQVAEELGETVQRERIRQILLQALRKMRRPGLILSATEASPSVAPARAPAAGP